MIKALIICIAIFSANTTLSKSNWFSTSEETEQQKVAREINSEKFNDQSAKQKLDRLWELIVQDRTPGTFYGAVHTAGVLTQNNQDTFEHKGDVFPDGREKLIHSVGVIAKVSFNVVPNHKYTGLLSSGAKNALLRLSAAKEYDVTKSSSTGAYNNFAPGFGLKFLVDNGISQNLVAMFDTMGQASWNYFKNTFTNNFRINQNPDLANKMIATSFARETNWISGVGLLDIASITENGTINNNPKYPFRLDFVPNPQLTKMFKDEYTEDYKKIISRIPSGTLIYTVFVIDEPGCEGEKIGELVSQSEFTTSLFSDRLLFFRHGLIDRDDKNFSGRSEARDFYSMIWGLKVGTEPRKPTKKCPFGY
jgi:hypothetical protein